MTKDEFKTIIEMVRMIMESSQNKAEALRKIDSLTILLRQRRRQNRIVQMQHRMSKVSRAAKRFREALLILSCNLLRHRAA